MSLNNIACSDGQYGLERFGYHTLGDVPNFPYLGGAQVVFGYGSESCGTCWQLSYHGNSIKVIALDHADSGFNVALGALNALTNNQAQFLGSVQATATQLNATD